MSQRAAACLGTVEERLPRDRPNRASSSDGSLSAAWVEGPRTHTRRPDSKRRCTSYRASVDCDSVWCTNAFLVARHARERTAVHQKPADVHEITTLVRLIEREAKARRGELRVRSHPHQLIAEILECDLRLRTLQHGTGEAEQNILAPSEPGRTARGVGQVRRGA